MKSCDIWDFFESTKPRNDIMDKKRYPDECHIKDINKKYNPRKFTVIAECPKKKCDCKPNRTNFRSCSSNRIRMFRGSYDSDKGEIRTQKNHFICFWSIWKCHVFSGKSLSESDTFLFFTSDAFMCHICSTYDRESENHKKWNADYFIECDVR